MSSPLGAAAPAFGKNRPLSGILEDDVRHLRLFRNPFVFPFSMGLLSLGLLSACSSSPPKMEDSLPAAAAVPATAAFRGDRTPQKLVLPNGLTVVVREDHRNSIVAVVTRVRSGYLHEDPSEAGISHLLEHMILRGTKSHPGFDEVPDRVRGMGGILNGATTFDHSETFMVVPANRADDALALAAEIYTQPVFDPSALARVKTVIRNEISHKLDDPVQAARDLLLQNVFAGEGMGRGAEAGLDSLERIGREQLVRFHTDHYRPANTVLSVAGDIEAEQVFERVRALFSDIPRGEMRKHRPSDVPAPQLLRFAQKLGEYNSNVVMVGFPLPALAKADLPALRILAAIIVDGQGSRLRMPFQVEHQWADRLETTIAPYSGTGLFEFLIEAPNLFEDQALRNFFVQLDHIRRHGVQTFELENARTLLANRRSSREMDVLAVARSQAAIDPLADDPTLAGEEAEAKVTVGDLQAAIGRWLTIPRSTVVELLDEQQMNARPIYARLDARKMQGHLEGGVLAEARPEDLPRFPPPPPSWYSRMELAGWARSFEKGPTETGLQRFEYPNGAVLVVRETREVPLTSVGLWFRGGRVTELANSMGITALLQSLLTQRSFNRTRSDLAHELGALGSALIPHRTLDAFGFGMNVWPGDFPYAFDVLYDLMVNPFFDQGTLFKARDHQIEQITSTSGNLFARSAELVRGAAWGDHAYGLPELGSMQSIKFMQLERLEELQADLCNPSNAVIVVTGPVDANEVHDFLDVYMRKWSDISGLYPAGAKAFFHSDLIDPLPSIEDGAVKEVHQSSPVAAVQLGFAALAADDPKRPAQDLLESWLNGFDGPLSEELEEKAPVYRIAVHDQGGALGSLLCAYAACGTQDLSAVENSLLESLEKAAANLPTGDDFSAAALRLSTRFQLDHQRSSRQNEFLAQREIIGLSLEDPLDHAAALLRVSPEELSVVAKKLLLDAPHVAGRVNGSVPGEKDDMEKDAQE